MDLRSRKKISASSPAELSKGDDDLPVDDGIGLESDKESSIPVSDTDDSSSSDYNAESDSDSSNYGSELVEEEVSKKQKAKVKVGSRNLQGTAFSPVTATNLSELPGPIRNKYYKSGKRKRDKKDPPLMWEIWEEENEIWIDQNMMADIDFDSHGGFMTETADVPSELTIPLLRYQREWLAWALKQEGLLARGGILADEMGMGKTLQAISLVLAERALQKGHDLEGPSLQSGSSPALAVIKATLVVCPVVAVLQWVEEIERFTSKGSTKFLVYHGANRQRNFNQFSQCDFIITTYSIVEAEFRKFMMPPKKKCDYCGRAFYERKLMVHLKYFCGPNAIRTEKQSKQQRKKPKFTTKQKTTNDEDESHGHANTKRKGKSKVFNTMNDYQASAYVHDKGKSILHSVKWKRIILDEAHFIKDRRCNTANAIFALESSYKWALSGTPLQNRVGELYSLVRFLQIVPYSYYLCKDCDCRTLDHRTPAKCSSCPHSSVRHFCWWNKYVSKPIQESGNSEEGRKAMVLLRQKVLKNIVLRRTKTGRAADLALPPRIVTLRRDTLDLKEEDYYESLYNDSRAQFDTYVKAGTLMNNYAHIFDLLTRLRQAVDHPYLVIYSKSALSKSGNLLDVDNIEQECGICHEPVEDSVLTSCDHVFCKACLLNYSASLGQVSCPLCSRLLMVDLTADAGNRSVKTTIRGFKSSSILNRVQLNDFQTSTKIEALREEIRFMFERDGSAKGIVFSQFTQFLDLINYSLQESGVTCVQLVGSMTLAARDAAIKRFTDDPECKIFLMSLKAGGIALNLTVASHVFLMDPWWNPAVERQAQDRIHRIGQYKPIRIVRFVIENTIEERILQLQEKKELVFEGTVGGSSEALGRLTEADLRFLFAS